MTEYDSPLTPIYLQTRERYIIIFLWKISQGKVGGYDVTFANSERRGRYAVPKSINKAASNNVRRAKEGSLGVRGALLFNLMPNHIRDSNVATTEAFKTLLDNFLQTIPDQPTVSGLVRGAETNSLIHQIPLVNNTLGTYG